MRARDACVAHQAVEDQLAQAFEEHAALARDDAHDAGMHVGVADGVVERVARARGGEILVSDALREYTETDPTFNFELRGEFHFKGMLGEHKVWAVAWAESDELTRG